MEDTQELQPLNYYTVLDDEQKREFYLGHYSNGLNIEEIYYQNHGYGEFNLKSVDISTKDIELFKNYFGFLIPKYPLENRKKVWLKTKQFERLYKECEYSKIKNYLPVFSLILNFLTGFTLKGRINNNSIENKLNEILKYLKCDLIEEPDDENIPPGFLPSHYISEVSFTFSKRIEKNSKETVGIKLDDLQNDIVQRDFESSLQFFLSTIPYQNLNQLQLNSESNSKEIVATKFYDFVVKEVSGITKNRIYELFVFLYEQSGHEFNVKGKTIAKREEDKINNVKQWVKISD